MGKSNFIVRGGADFSELDKKMQALEKKMKRWGKDMERVGRGMTIGVTAPIVAMGTASLNAAIDFESAFAGVRKTVNGTEAEFAALEKGIVEMTKAMPQSASDIARIAEAAGQLGIETDNILAFAKVMAMLGDSTNLSSEEAASNLARFANITQMSQQDFDKLGSVIVALGNNFATTESEIVDMAMRLAGAGSQIGMSEAEIMGLAASLSSVGIEAEAGGSAFSKVMVQMQLATEVGGKSLEDFARVAGMSSSEFAEAFKKDAAGALTTFIKGLQNTDKLGGSAIKVLDDMGITEVRLRDSLLRAAGAGDLFNEAINLGTKAWGDNNALTKEAQQRYETTASKLAILKNRINIVAMQIGDILIPIVMEITDKIGEWADKFSKLDEDTQKTIVKFAAFAAAIGPVLVVSGKLVTSLSSIAKFLRLAGKRAPEAGAIGKTFLGINPTLLTTAAILGGILATIMELGRQKDIWDNILGGQGLIDKNLNPAGMATRYGTDYAFNSGSTQGVAYAGAYQNLTGNKPSTSATILGRGGTRPEDLKTTIDVGGTITIKGDTSKKEFDVAAQRAQESILNQLRKENRR